MTLTTISFCDLDAARVWNYWFAHRDLSGAPGSVCDPFAEDYALDQALCFAAARRSTRRSTDTSVRWSNVLRPVHSTTGASPRGTASPS